MIKYLVYSVCLFFFFQRKAHLQIVADFLTAVTIQRVSQTPNSFYEKTWIIIPNGGVSLDFNFEKTKYGYINIDYIWSDGKLYKYDFKKEPLSLINNDSAIKIRKDNTIDLKYQSNDRTEWFFVRKFRGTITQFLI